MYINICTTMGVYTYICSPPSCINLCKQLAVTQRNTISNHRRGVGSGASEGNRKMYANSIAVIVNKTYTYGISYLWRCIGTLLLFVSCLLWSTAKINPPLQPHITLDVPAWHDKAKTHRPSRLWYLRLNMLTVSNDLRIITEHKFWRV